MKKLIAAAALSLAFAGAASAQVIQIVELDDDVVVAPFGLTVGQLEDLSITDAAGTRLGDIEEVIGTAADGPSALVIDLENTRTNVIVPLERFSSSNGVVTVQATPEELAALPAYAD